MAIPKNLGTFNLETLKPDFISWPEPAQMLPRLIVWLLGDGKGVWGEWGGVFLVNSGIFQCLFSMTASRSKLRFT
jgi:hypothetical protein